MRPAALPVLVLGAGAWGTAMAASLARAAQTEDSIRGPLHVTLWGRDADQVTQIAQQHENKKYLPGIALPSAVHCESDFVRACQAWRARSVAHRDQPAQSVNGLLHGLIILATPMSGIDTTAREIYRALGPAQSGEGLIWLAKGLKLTTRNDLTELQWPHEIIRVACPDWPAGALSGPSFAQEVASGLPVALSLASNDMAWARQAAQICHGETMRVYPTDDLVGVELGGAMKNVLAIAAGICDGMQLGANARAALLTRGLAEMCRLGVAIGAKAETFIGLATLGDLILTATGDLSRNRRVGLALARGETLQQALSSLGHVAEGVATAPAILALAKRIGVEVPITQSVVQLLCGESSAKQAVQLLMARELKDEHGR